jgi:hypothetical protein
MTVYDGLIRALTEHNRKSRARNAHNELALLFEAAQRAKIRSEKGESFIDAVCGPDGEFDPEFPPIAYWVRHFKS